MIIFYALLTSSTLGASVFLLWQWWRGWMLTPEERRLRALRPLSTGRREVQR